MQTEWNCSKNPDLFNVLLIVAYFSYNNINNNNNKNKYFGLTSILLILKP